MNNDGMQQLMDHHEEIINRRRMIIDLAMKVSEDLYDEEDAYRLAELVLDEFAEVPGDVPIEHELPF